METLEITYPAVECESCEGRFGEELGLRGSYKYEGYGDRCIISLGETKDCLILWTQYSTDKGKTYTDHGTDMCQIDISAPQRFGKRRSFGKDRNRLLSLEYAGEEYGLHVESGIGVAMELSLASWRRMFSPGHYTVRCGGGAVGELTHRKSPRRHHKVAVLTFDDYAILAPALALIFCGLMKEVSRPVKEPWWARS